MNSGEEFRVGDCLGCGKNYPPNVYCPNCPPDTGKFDEEICSMQIQVIPSKAKAFTIEALESSDLSTDPNAAERLLKSLLNDMKVGKAIQKVQRRYRKLDTSKLGAIVATNFVVSQIICPLQEAQRSYLLGNWISCITAIGIACECLSILICRMSEIRITLDGDDNLAAATLYTDQLENMTQNDRTKVLHELGLISKEQKEKFNLIRNHRNNYVHFTQQINEGTQKKNADECFTNALELVNELICAKNSTSGAELSPRLAKYLNKVTERSDPGK